MGNHHQTSGKPETIPGAGHGAFVGQVLGDLLEPATYEPVERLQNERGLAEAVDQLPCRIATGEMGQFVCKETCLMLDGEIAHPFGTADLRSSDAGGEGNGDRL